MGFLWFLVSKALAFVHACQFQDMKQLEKEMNLKQSHVVYSRSLEHLVEEALQAIPSRILPRHTSKSMGRVKQSLIVATTKSIPPRALL